MQMTPERIMADISTANYHHDGLKSARLFHVDPDFFARLQAELKEFVDAFKPSDVTGKQHVTNWTRPFGRAFQYSLYNRSGDPADYSFDHRDHERGKSFHHHERFPTLGTFIDTLAATSSLTNMRFNVLDARSGLSPHEEHVVHNQPGTKRVYVRPRFHLPILTHDKARMMTGWDEFHYDEGTLYFFNNGCVHDAVNGADESRCHLVWDMLLSQATYDLMFARTTRAPFLTPIDDWSCEVIGHRERGRYEKLKRPVSEWRSRKAELFRWA